MSPADRLRLEAVVADRNSRQKHIWRAKVVLAAAEGHGTAARAPRRPLQALRPALARAVRQEGVAGLLRDKTRKPGTPPLPPAFVDRVVELTLQEPPGRSDALDRPGDGEGRRHLLRSVQRMWEGAPDRAAPGAHLQALQGPGVRAQAARRGRALPAPAGARDRAVRRREKPDPGARAHPAGAALKEGRPATATTRAQGTTTLFAALNVLDGTVLGRCMQRHRHQEFIRFLNAVEAAVPAGKLVHAILDNYGTHKHPKVMSWLERHPRWTFHFTPTACSWLNAVETFSPSCAQASPAARQLPLPGRVAGGDQPLRRGAQPEPVAFSNGRPDAGAAKVDLFRPGHMPKTRRRFFRRYLREPCSDQDGTLDVALGEILAEHCKFLLGRFALVQSLVIRRPAPDDPAMSEVELLRPSPSGRHRCAGWVSSSARFGSASAVLVNLGWSGSGCGRTARQRCWRA